MAKIPPIQQDGVVQKTLSGAIFEVVLKNGHLVRAHISGKMHKNNIKILPGDSVRMELTPYDLTQARIVHRYKPNE